MQDIRDFLSQFLRFIQISEKNKQKKHSSRMCPLANCMCFGGHQMSVPVGGQWSPKSGGKGSWDQGGARALYSDVQCTMGNDHMWNPWGQTDWQTHMTEKHYTPTTLLADIDLIMDWWSPSGVGTILILPESAPVPPWRNIRHFQETFVWSFSMGAFENIFITFSSGKGKN